MGSDKVSLVVDGRPMVVGVSDALWEAGCHPVVCQGGDAELIASFGLDTIADTQPGAGPVSAIRDAVTRHDGFVVVTACDLPDLDAASIRVVIAALDGGGLASVATSDGRRHLLSCWSVDATPIVEQAVVEGVTSYRELLDRVGAIEVPVSPPAMRNVNHPEDAD